MHLTPAPPRAAFRAPRIALLLALLAPLAAAGDEAILKSPADSRVYRHVELDNGLRAVLVSDPEADEAAVSLDVNVGNGLDPPGREGLAHFLEHMLFLGTEKYPEAGEYKDFITANGGRENAFTSFEHTNYFFSIEPGQLEPAVDRFAQFFIAPRLDPEFVAREREVVHSEFTSKLESDGRRIGDALRQVYHPDHPVARFTVGTRDTLGDREGAPVRDDLVAFYERHYSADVMALSVLGREPLDALERMVRAHFSAVPRRPVRTLDIDVPIIAVERLPARIDVVPVDDIRVLRFSFPIPSPEPYFRTKPLYLISDLLGHEGPGSLLSVLKARGWVESLSAGSGFRHDSGALFEVSVSVTEAGLARWREIGAALFSQLGLIERDGLEPWRYRELQTLNRVRFRFAETAAPLSLVRTLAGRLHEYPPAEVLRGPYLVEQFDADLTRRFLARLRPDNVLVTRAARGLETDEQSPWYSAPYRVETVDAATLARWSEPGPLQDAALPEPNPFLPDDLEMRTVDTNAGPVPAPILEAPGVTLWHQQDRTFGLPKLDFFVSIQTPAASASVREAVLGSLFVSLVNDRLNEYSYPASLAGLDYDLYRHARGFSIRLSGYSANQTPLLERILDALVHPVIDAGRFAIRREAIERSLANSLRAAPHRRATGEIGRVVVEPRHDVEARLAMIATLGVEELRAYASRVFDRTEVVALAHGNVTREEALALAAKVEAALVAPAERTRVDPPRILTLPAGSDHRRFTPTTQPDRAVAVYYQGREKSLDERARAALLVQLMRSAFFDRLRTELQLGYVVHAQNFWLRQVPGVAFVVQSPNASTARLVTEIENFLSAFAHDLDALDDARLAVHRAGLVAAITQAETNLHQRSGRYWAEIDREAFGFDSRARLAAAVDALRIEDIRAFHARLFDPATRRRLVVESARVDEASPALAPGGTRIVDRAAFKRGRPYFPG